MGQTPMLKMHHSIPELHADGYDGGALDPFQQEQSETALSTLAPAPRRDRYRLPFIALSLLFGTVVSLVLVETKAQPAPEATMPTVVDVAGVEWGVDLLQTDTPYMERSVLGHTECNMRRIYIRHSEEDRVVLLHELLHAHVCGGSETDFGINNLYYNSMTNDAHEGVYRVSSFYSELFTRNPQLALWVSEKK